MMRQIMVVLLFTPLLFGLGTNEPPENVLQGSSYKKMADLDMLPPFFSTMRNFYAIWEYARGIEDSANAAYLLAGAAVDSADTAFNLAASAYDLAGTAQDSAATAMDTALAALNQSGFDADTSHFGTGTDEITVVMGTDTGNPVYHVEMGTELMRNNADDDTLYFGTPFADSVSYQIVWTIHVGGLDYATDSLRIGQFDKHSGYVVMRKAYSCVKRIMWIAIGIT